MTIELHVLPFDRALVPEPNRSCWHARLSGKTVTGQDTGRKAWPNSNTQLLVLVCGQSPRMGGALNVGGLALHKVWRHSLATTYCCCWWCHGKGTRSLMCGTTHAWGIPRSSLQNCGARRRPPVCVCECVSNQASIKMAGSRATNVNVHVFFKRVSLL